MGFPIRIVFANSFDLLSTWADRPIIVPSESGKARSWLHPLATSAGAPAFAIRES